MPAFDRTAGQLAAVRSERSPDLHLDFEAEPTAAAQAREAAAGLFAENEQIAADVALVVSELVTNVVIHTNEPGTIDIWDVPEHHRLRIEVRDCDPRPPRTLRSASAAGGFGLRIVDRLTVNWGHLLSPPGKVVWSELER